MKAETPPMTVKELREYIASRPPRLEAIETRDEMQSWYFANLHLITNAEDAAFRRTIGDLCNYVNEEIKRENFRS